jgi:hypothetical protein
MADYWAKIYIEIIDDPKMATMPDRLWRRTIELFLLAKKFNNGGHLPDTKQIAWCLRISTDDLDLDLKQISSTGIIRRDDDGWFVVHFEKRQAASTNTERSQQYRKRTQSEQYYNADETQLQRNVAQSTETETESETEQTVTPPPFAHLSAMIATKIKVPEFAGGAQRWTTAIQSILDVNPQECDIDNAIEYMDEHNMSIVGPWSLVNPIVIAVGQRERGPKKSKKHVSAGMRQILENV